MDIEEIMIQFLLTEATESQIEEFFGFNNPGHNREEIECVLAQMPDNVFDELVEEFGLPKDGVKL